MRSLLTLLVFAVPLLAAPVPAADDKPKPRAKLLGTLPIDRWVQAVHWTPDGKHLVLVTDSQVVVYPRSAVGESDPKQPPKPLTTFERPDRGSVQTGQPGQVGVTADGGVWAVAPAGPKVNAENRLLLWDAKTLTAGGENAKPDRVVDLEADNPRGAVLATDGKSLYATLGQPRLQYDQSTGRQGLVYSPKVVRMSARTGDQKHTFAHADLFTHECGGAAVDPRTGRLYTVLLVGDELQIHCREPDGGKAVWDHTVASGKPYAEQNLGATFTFSPAGDWLTVAQPVLITAPGGAPGAPPRQARGFDLTLLNVKSGKPGPELSKPDVQAAVAHSFSADGRLLFGRVQSPDGQEHRMTVWDTKTGAELKVWVRNQPVATAAFAPTGHELLIADQDNGRLVLGVWDLAPLVK